MKQASNASSRPREQFGRPILDVDTTAALMARGGCQVTKEGAELASFAAQTLIADIARQANIRAITLSSKHMGVPAPHASTLATTDLLGFLQDKGLAVADTSMWRAAADTRFAPPQPVDLPAPTPSTAPAPAPAAAPTGAVELFPLAAAPAPAPKHAPAKPTEPAAATTEMPGGMKFANVPLGAV